VGEGVTAVWRDYNHETDYEAVVLLHEQMQQRLGRDFPLLNPSQRPTLLCMVREEDGVLTHFVIGEAEMEVTAAGETAVPSKEFSQVAQRFTEVAHFYRIQIARAFVPAHMLESRLMHRKQPIQRLLDRLGFTEDNGEVRSFWRWLSPAEQQKVG
jgi:hypothetical protein